MGRVKDYFNLVKFSHTIFALPFALIGFTIALDLPQYSFTFSLLIKLLLCMVFARNMAMGFNRFADREIDALNPRTADREIPSGKLSPRSVLIFTIINSVAFIGTTILINRLCFSLSFVAIALLLGYSYTKRFTSFSHIVLGLAMSVAPTAAYIAVTGEFALEPIILSGIVLLWGSGFDILYSLADEEFDLKNGLHSVPQKFGKSGAFWISGGLHLLTLPLIIWFYFAADMSWLYIVGGSIFLLMLIYQHSIISPSNLKRLNSAFFTANGTASFLFALFAILDIVLL